ncbi:alpha/beta fold hydrolase [Aspergillus brunneoviolaceus CBS 621.78]|uniref:Alpha/beta fold family hydrolase n=1 Tax=Aspergillus brunneoviolaceus CBS 621.78 TaxID=1450534 RepID=A0ACD1G7X8_9EURO|nr:putative alpha/beta fold family hydrolase [Aspergillus brunneoviolaceus CBS 621.78]RAH45317.1 putative alpha/beta fold family hydrolase [Aspergillus brunneoviolaceus CBS 621.78]
MPFATTSDNQEIYYETHGPATSATTLAFVSGYFGITAIWHSLITRLSARGYRCIAHDSRGYGRSAKPTAEEAYSIPRHAEDVHAVLAAADIPPTSQLVLVTHSMGGNIGAAYCLAHPGRVAGLIQTGTYIDGARIQAILSYEALTSGVESPSKCVAFYTNMGLEEATALEAAKWPAYCRRYNARALLGWAIGDDQYADLTVPGLVVQGELDAATPVELLCRPIVEAMPACRLAVLPGVAHFPPTEAPEEVERLVVEFVRGL